MPVSRETDPVRHDSGMSGKIAGYRLDRYIGQGGTAVVYLATDERQDRQAALKILAPELARDAVFRTRFLQESRAAAAVDDPHIIPVYEADYASGTLYLAMRYVRGGDVRLLLNRLGPLPVAYAWSIVAQVASALDAAHARGLIHGDVKPANMLLDTGGTADGRGTAGGGTPRPADGGDFDHVFLSDFGMSRNLPPAEITATGQVAGMLDYAAPEQIEGRALSGRADLYSLACAGFELLCGTPPFGQDQGLTVMYAQLYAPPPAATSRRPDLPAAVDQVLATALAKNPADRYATCGQFAEALHTALGLLPGEPDMSARPRGPGRAGPVAEAGPAAGEEGPGRRHEPEPELVPASAPAPPEPAPPEPAPPEPAPPEPAPPEPAPPEPAQFATAQFATAPPEPAQFASAPPEPGWPGPEPLQLGPYPRPPRRRPGVITLIFAVTAVVIAAVVAGVVLSNSPAPGTSGLPSPAASSPAAAPAPAPSPAPPPSSTLASRQAAAVNNLLGSSATTRQTLQDAVSQIRNCANLSSAASQIQSVVNQRSTEYRKASALSTAALANGVTMKSRLMSALHNSLDADRDYLTWAQQQLSSGCTPTAQSSAYIAANNADQQADAAKEAFVQVWNPVAARHGARHKSPGSI